MKHQKSFKKLCSEDLQYRIFLSNIILAGMGVTSVSYGVINLPGRAAFRLPTNGFPQRLITCKMCKHFKTIPSIAVNPADEE
jgi:hypothetical protein